MDLFDFIGESKICTTLSAISLKVKKLTPHAVIPKYAHLDDAAMDLYAVDGAYDFEGDYIEYGTGLAIEIPKNHMGLIFPRSSVSKTPLILANCIGLIDPNFRGEVCVRFKRLKEDKEHLEYQAGDRIAQLLILPYPTIEIEEVSELSETDRGTGGFGSSGR